MVNKSIFITFVSVAIQKRFRILRDTCVADNPQVRIISTQNKDGCDKAKVRNALLNCAHHTFHRIVINVNRFLLIFYENNS